MKIELLIMVSIVVLGKFFVVPILESVHMYNMIFYYWFLAFILSLFIMIVAISKNFEEIKKEFEKLINKF